MQICTEADFSARHCPSCIKIIDYHLNRNFDRLLPLAKNQIWPANLPPSITEAGPTAAAIKWARSAGKKDFTHDRSSCQIGPQKSKIRILSFQSCIQLGRKNPSPAIRESWKTPPLFPQYFGSPCWIITHSIRQKIPVKKWMEKGEKKRGRRRHLCLKWVSAPARWLEQIRKFISRILMTTAAAASPITQFEMFWHIAIMATLRTKFECYARFSTSSKCWITSWEEKPISLWQRFSSCVYVICCCCCLCVDKMVLLSTTTIFEAHKHKNFFESTQPTATEDT